LALKSFLSDQSGTLDYLREMDMDDFLKSEFWRTMVTWFVAATHQVQEFSSALIPQIVAWSSEPEFVLIGALLALALVGLILFARMRSLRSQLSSLKSELQELRSRYDAELRWRMARERYEKRQEASSPPPANVTENTR
jgi:hypothetical protein